MQSEAFGRPGIAPTWASSAKDLVTTGLGRSRVWATVGYGILNEVYWPATGSPQIRDLGFIVRLSDRWVEVKRARAYRLRTPAPFVPLPEAVHEGDGYRLVLEFLPDPDRDVVLIRYELEAEEGARLYPLLAPHLGGSGSGNTAWVDDGLRAVREDAALCLLADAGFLRGSAGYVGRSDGWQDFDRNGGMTMSFARAEQGNVALIGELPAGAGTLALGFATTPEGARTLAASSLVEGYEPIRERFVERWARWGGDLDLPAPTPEVGAEALRSATVLKVHEDRAFPGAVVASLSIPWGSAHDDPGGYHLVWARDAVESGLALLAAGRADDARRMLAYLVATQRPDGSWSQNFFPDGRPFWTGIQLDEVAFPILFAARLAETGKAGGPAVAAMTRGAAGYLARTGPVSPQDRWEENPGANPFTLAVEIAALVAAAPGLEGAEREYALGLADCWNERIEEWTYVEGSPLAARCGVRGHYVRIAPAEAAGGLRGRVEVKNTPGETVAADALVGLEFLYLSRLGLRAPDDPRIRDTLAVVDSVLAIDTPAGRTYHRYNLDGYGEHEDGSPFDGTGVGRGWPLLTGERGHAALLDGRDPLDHLEAMTRMTGPGGLIPEQVWDSDPIPERDLYPGRPSGSAMPLVWAHAEFLKLLVARERGRPLELLDAVRERYGGTVPRAATWYWRDEVPIDALPPGRALVVEDRQPFTLHLGFDGWQEVRELPSAPLGLGMNGVTLAPADLASRSRLDFTRRYRDGERWEGRDHHTALAGGGGGGS